LVPRPSVEVTWSTPPASCTLCSASSNHGYFWPGWILGGWSTGLALHAWKVYGPRPISEEEIRREMSRRGGGRA
jgi:hypothetical protein